MIKENRYLVFKYKDIYKYLSLYQQEKLLDLSTAVNLHRLLDDKNPITCVVVEDDWPEYEQVWKLIETRVDKIKM